MLLASGDFREFVELLNSNGVSFLIVGGYAVAMHGYLRFTGDLEVWVATDPENATRVAKVLTDFGFASLKLSAKDFARPGYAIQLGRPPYRIDLLTSIDAVAFSEAYRRRRTVRVGTLRVPFIGFEGLLTNKRATARPQDLVDVEKLCSATKKRSVTTRPTQRKHRRRNPGAA